MRGASIPTRAQHAWLHISCTTASSAASACLLLALYRRLCTARAVAARSCTALQDLRVWACGGK